MSDDDFRLEFRTEDGEEHLLLVGREGWRSPICPVCHEPIRWVLDMASFTSLEKGAYRLAHARCVWQPEAFDDRRLDDFGR